MKTKTRYVGLLLRGILPCALMGCSAITTCAINYTFTKIVDNQGPFNGISVAGPQSINDNGEVVFRGSDGSIHIGSGGAITTIAPNAATQEVFISSTVAINNDGDVVYAGRNYTPNNEESIFRWSEGFVSSAYTKAYSLGLFIYNPVINNSGAVAFASAPVNDLPGYNYLLADGAQATVVANGGTSSNCCFNGPEVNDSGQMAYWIKSTNGGYDLLRFDHPGTTPIVSGLYRTWPISMNNSGYVAFVQSDFGAPYESYLQVYRNGSLQTVASTVNTFSQLGKTTFINDLGEIAFDGSSSLGNGVFTGPDPATDRVITDGDMLFGKPVNVGSVAGMNNSGQILFNAFFGPTSGEHALVVATPIPDIEGDYNLNGIVDAGDYVVWRKRDGTQTGYDKWRNNFGKSASGDMAEVANVPEASSLRLAILLCAVTFLRRLPSRARMLRLSGHGLTWHTWPICSGPSSTTTSMLSARRWLR